MSNSLAVAAVVVSHARPEYLRETLAALAAQNFKPQQIIVVETASDSQSLEIAKQFGLATIEPGPLKLGAAIEAGLRALQREPGWLWVLHEDSAPDPDVLGRMARTIEISPSVAIVGPKLIEWHRPILIQQLGLTVTTLGTPFLLVQQEYDQGQHDRVEDTLAVSTAGMLISISVWKKLGGLIDSSPVFAADLELGIRARLSGFRVMVEPSARVRHAGLAMTGKRGRSWLGGSRALALRKAQLHISTMLLPAPLALLQLLLLPVLAVARSLTNLINKRPQKIPSEFALWLWGWFTIGARFAARKRLKGLGPVRAIRPLFAGASEIRARRQSRLRQLPAAAPGLQTPGLWSSGAIWWAILPLIASARFWPQGDAAVSAILIPASSSWLEIFRRAGSIWQPLGFGMSIPADPFVWVVSAIGLLWPAAPSFGIAIFIFISPLLTFFGTWWLLARFTSKAWVRTLLALGFALNPFLTGAQAAGALVEIAAITLLPFALLTLVNTGFALTPSRSWRWLGLTALFLALLAAAAPAALLAIFVPLLALMIIRPRRALVVIWAPLGGLALLYPYWQRALDVFEPLLIFTGSALSQNQWPLFGPEWLMILPALLFAGLTMTTRAWPTGLALWGFAAAVGAFAWWLPVGSVPTLLALSYLSVLAAAAIFLDGLPAAVSGKAQRAQAAIAGLALLALSVPGPLAAWSNPIGVSWSTDRVLPALVVASAEAGQGLRTLQIQASPAEQNQGQELIAARLIWGAGEHLENISILYNRELPKLQASPGFLELAELTALLAAGNPDGLPELLEDAGIGFILLSPPAAQPGLVSEGGATAGAEIVGNLNSLSVLEPAGETRFGQLWRVGNPVAASPYPEANNFWKLLQLGILGGFALLAIPTAASIRGTRRHPKTLVSEVQR